VSKTAELVALAGRVMTPNYAPAPVVFTRGDGMWLEDLEGKKYLDFAAGIAVSALGHDHPALAQALSEQAHMVLHLSNLFLNEPALRLAERLTQLSFADRVYFGNSGAEANEAAFKLARRYMRMVRKEDRYGFICMEKSFHGRTWAAITATGQPKYHEGFQPLVPGFSHVPYNDLAAVEAAIEPTTCAVVVETLQGEGGVKPAAPGYLEGLRALCDKHGILLILDEVQTGIGRTGRWFGHEHAGITPDIMSLAKGLAGGVPIGAMVCTEEVSKGFAPGAHASTFGGNPLACAAGLAVLRTIETEELVQNAAVQGARLQAGLKSLEGLPGVLGARGQGLLQGLVLDTEDIDRAAVVNKARELGLLLTMAGYDTIRLCPPLIAGPYHIDLAVEILGAALTAVTEGK
jgi:acetylornithine/N-succinyldiaminopimelate aminotransferase